MTWPEALGGRGLSHVDAALVEDVLGYHWLPLSLYLLSYKTIGCALERFASPELKEQTPRPDRARRAHLLPGLLGAWRGERSGVADDARRAARRRCASSAGTRSGRRARGSPTGSTSRCAPTRTSRAIAGSRSSLRRSTRPGSRCAASRCSAAATCARCFSTASRFPAENLVGEVDRGWDVLMHTLDFERITAEKLGGLAWVLDALERRLAETGRLDAAWDRGRARFAASSPPRDFSRCARPTFSTAGSRRARRPRWRSSPAHGSRSGSRVRAIELLGLEGLADGHPSLASRGPHRRSLPRVRRLDDLRRLGRDPADRHRSARVGTAMTLPLEGVRVVEYAQYVAGPLCGVLLADLGADVVKVEPPHGDGYRQVMPIAPERRALLRAAEPGQALGRARPEDRRRDSRRAGGSFDAADVVLHNFPRERAQQVRPRLGGRARCVPGTGRRSRHLVRHVGAARGCARLRPDRAGAGRLTHGARVRAATRCRSARAASRWPISPPASCSRPGSSPRSSAHARPGRGSSSTSRSSPRRWRSSSRISSGSTVRQAATRRLQRIARSSTHARTRSPAVSP